MHERKIQIWFSCRISKSWVVEGHWRKTHSNRCRGEQHYFIICIQTHETHATQQRDETKRTSNVLLSFRFSQSMGIGMAQRRKKSERVRERNARLNFQFSLLRLPCHLSHRPSSIFPSFPFPFLSPRTCHACQSVCACMPMLSLCPSLSLWSVVELSAWPCPLCELSFFISPSPMKGPQKLVKGPLFYRFSLL